MCQGRRDERITSANSTGKIYIVEDDEKLAQLFQRQLVQFGYDTRIGQDFQHIDEEVDAYQPQLILLDINLPYYDGFYWCRLIRRFSKVPIIFLSARTGDMDQVLALEHGGDDYLTKPFHPEVLLAKVRALFEADGKTVTRDQLLAAVWDDVQFIDDNTLTVNVTRVRGKLAKIGLPHVIETVRGVGYRLLLQPPVDEAPSQ